MVAAIISDLGSLSPRRFSEYDVMSVNLSRHQMIQKVMSYHSNVERIALDSRFTENCF